MLQRSALPIVARQRGLYLGALGMVDHRRRVLVGVTAHAAIARDDRDARAGECAELVDQRVEIRGFTEPSVFRHPALGDDAGDEPGAARELLAARGERQLAHGSVRETGQDQLGENEDDQRRDEDLPEKSRPTHGAYSQKR